MDQSPLEQLPDIFIFGVKGEELVTFRHAPGIRVNDKNWMITCIQKNGICRLWTHAVELQQFLPQLEGVLREHTVQ
jgi:hypothetical protein